MKRCVFCGIANGEIGANRIYEDHQMMAFLDRDPINEGHVLIIPKLHYLDYDEVPEGLAVEMMKLAHKLTAVIKTVYKPDGYSIMQNGGSFNDIGHYHLHVFPRYKGDGFGWTFGEDDKENNDEIAERIRIGLHRRDKEAEQ